MDASQPPRGPRDGLLRDVLPRDVLPRGVAFAAGLLAALAVGLGLALIDSQPGWDDTAISAFAVLLAAGTFGLLAPAHPYRWALAIGGWFPLLEARQGNPGAWAALGVAFLGAYGGSFARRALVAESSR